MTTTDRLSAKRVRLVDGGSSPSLAMVGNGHPYELRFCLESCFQSADRPSSRPRGSASITTSALRTRERNLRFLPHCPDRELQIFSTCCNATNADRFSLSGRSCANGSQFELCNLQAVPQPQLQLPYNKKLASKRATLRRELDNSISTQDAVVSLVA